MNTLLNLLRYLSVAVFVLLGACGGGGDGDNTSRATGTVQLAQTSIRWPLMRWLTSRCRISIRRKWRLNWEASAACGARDFESVIWMPPYPA